MDISKLYDIFKKYPLVTTDTRKCTKDSIFFALKGESFNGNEYAEKAIALGCKYAIVDEAKYETLPNILLVDDCLKTLQDLANYHRRKLKTPIIGITGTNGKTTTKELMASVLSMEYDVLATEGNLNNHIGVPLTLLKLEKHHEVAIIEMGANHVGEIAALANIAQPNLGIITNIGYAHLEGFGSYENIIKAKSELYEYIRNSSDGKLVVDKGNELLMKLSEGIPSIYYGLEDDLFISGRVLSLSPFLEFDWKFVDTRFKVRTNLIGKYNLPNALAAIAVGKYFGVKTNLICQALEEYEPENNRSQLQRTDKNMLIIDAYNANPTSMIAALDNFSQMEVNHKILILGDMKELGPDTDMEHQKIVDYVAERKFDEVFYVGEYFSHAKTDEQKYKTFDDLRLHLVENPIENSYILIKGSRGGKLERCIELL